MKTITKDMRAAEAAERWRMQYDCGSGRNSHDVELTYKKLLALGSTPTPKEVDTVTGNKSWTQVECDLCDEECDAVIVLTNTWGGRTLGCCVPCLVKAQHQIISDLSDAEDEDDGA